MTIDRVLTGVLAYLTILIQVGLIAAWPIYSATPHLIAMISPLFLVFKRPNLGLIWIGIGAGFYDWLLPGTFGSTLFALLVSYVLLAIFSSRYIETWSWYLIIVSSLVLVLFSELPLAIWSTGWSQLGRDLLWAAILMVPIGIIAVRSVQPYQQGLRVERRSYRGRNY